MKDASLRAKKLAGLLRKLRTVQPRQMPGASDPVAVLVMSFLLWESTTDKALAAYARLMANVVDFNDLRVCMPQETAEFIGIRYPVAVERCERLRAVLRDIYLREHAVSLDRLKSLSKREVREYLETLHGMVGYVAARVMLLAFDAHAIPADEQLRARLIDEEIIEESVDEPQLSGWLTAQIKAAEGAAAHHGLQAWVDKTTGRSRPRRPRSTSPLTHARPATK